MNSMKASTTLLERYQLLKAEQQHLRQRDAAELMGVSEAELVACLPSTRRLRADWAELLTVLKTLGELKAITRNQIAVHEKNGRVDHLSVTKTTALLLNPGGLDLRLFLLQWHFAFAVEQESPRGVLRSLQVYDEHGVAVIKFYLTSDESLPAWQQLVEGFAIEASPELGVSAAPVAAASAAMPDSFDAAAFASDWLALKDVHHFNPLLRKYGVDRRQAFAHAPAGYATELALNSIEVLLEKAVAIELPIMVFVGNRGSVQIHTGAIQKVKRLEGWLNILDPGFNLHLQDGLLHDIWVVQRPTKDGIVTSVDAFNEAGETIISFFGKRVEGEPELSAWHQLAVSLPVREVVHG